MSGYVPGSARWGEPTPQTDPDLFSVEDLRAEMRHLSRLDRRHGTHTLRVLARVRLSVEVARRLSAGVQTPGGTPGEASSRG